MSQVPMSFHDHLTLAFAHLDQEQYADALSHLHKAQALGENTKLHVGFAMCYFDSFEQSRLPCLLDRAIAEAKNAVDLYDCQFDSQFLLAQYLSTRYQLVKAPEDRERAVEAFHKSKTLAHQWSDLPLKEIEGRINELVSEIEGGRWN